MKSVDVWDICDEHGYHGELLCPDCNKEQISKLSIEAIEKVLLEKSE